MKNNNRRILVSLLALVIVFFVTQLGHGREFKGVTLNEGLDDLTHQLTKDLPSKSSTTVMIADFHNLDGEITGLGRYVAEEMIPKLFNLGRLRVIERGQLEKAMEELKFNQTDLFDPDLTQKLGKFVGADAILAGTITSLDSVVRINARLFNTEQMEVMAAGTATIIRDEEVERLLKIKLKPASFYTTKPRDGEKERSDVQNDPKDVTMPTLVFENDLLRVTVKGLRRSGSSLILEVWYENLTEETMRLVSTDWGRAYATGHRGTYLLGENGEKWLFEDDNQVGNHYGGTELVPHQRLLNEITFKPEDRGEGSVFTYVGKYSVRWRNNPRKPYQHESLEVIIRDIRPGNYDDQDRPATSDDPVNLSYNQVPSGDPGRGERIYRTNCVVCHGQRGDGRGKAALSLNPAPKDFRSSILSRDQIGGVIRDGIRGTAMVSFRKTISEQDIQDVTEYVIRFRRR